jgi:uncharacterized protein (DUF433 family)
LPLDASIFGQGIYTPRQAARLVGTTPQEVLRWTRGSGPNDPLWSAYYHELENSTELNFADLIELRVVKAFRRASVSLQSIRFAIDFAQERYGVDRPLVNLEFRTDGTEILMNALELDGEYVSLSKKRAGQKVFAKIVEQSLQDLEYDDGTAARWRPTQHKDIVLDPQRQFGQPILDESGISTELLLRELSEIGDESYLAKIYEIPKHAVKAAVRYEASLQPSDGQGSV